MVGQASLRTELTEANDENQLLDEICEDLEELVDERDNLVRVERNFAGDDVFVQTSDYNVFIKETGMTFHGLDKDKLYGNEPVLDYLEEVYETDLMEELLWY